MGEYIGGLCAKEFWPINTQPPLILGEWVGKYIVGLCAMEFWLINTQPPPISAGWLGILKVFGTQGG